ncbi:SelT/SelW/SelH family protein [Komagataeibacter oboediens]|uniref:SelT/SelW/SelH family protein n=1 Tax=Komagataeibacter oboediens TaxID=65958 RepID=UPI0023DA2CB4|nr:SelT/SelW/SelH family protein [Komagataeibacter oboediens]WEQ51316.1 SelT/SelW/SelH family protein [Komagataeibacter oboediens]
MTTDTPPAHRPHVSIVYCTQCNWLLRAGWMAQELLSTFGEDLGGVTLVPGSGGHFEITVDGHTIWERKRNGGFPGPKELKQRVRDIIAPDRDMGHIDREKTAPHDPPGTL